MEFILALILGVAAICLTLIRWVLTAISVVIATCLFIVCWPFVLILKIREEKDTDNW